MVKIKPFQDFDLENTPVEARSSLSSFTVCTFYSTNKVSRWMDNTKLRSLNEVSGGDNKNNKKTVIMIVIIIW